MCCICLSGDPRDQGTSLLGNPLNTTTTTSAGISPRRVKTWCWHDDGCDRHLTAIPTFRFEGHFTAVVSRGPAPGRSRGWRGPAFDRSYSCTRVLQSYSRWLFFCFLWSNDRTKTDVCFLSFFFDHLDWQKLFTNPKKAMQSLLPPQWRSPRIWVLPKIVGRPTASIGRSPLSKPKEHRHAKLELKERALFPVPLMVQDFDRRSNPNCPFNHD